MSEAVSALQGAVFEGFVRVADAGPQGMITLRGDFSSTAFATPVGKVSGTDLPDIGRIVTTGTRSLAWMSPDELLLLCPYGEVPDAVAQLERTLAGTHHLVANVSDARALLTVTGGDAREAIAKVTPADVSPAAFAPGQFRRSRLAQVPAAFWMPDDTGFSVICFRSVARYVHDLLAMSARKGSEVGYF